MTQSIVVKELSKCFRLGALKHETMLREVLVNFVKHPLRRAGNKDNTLWALKNVSFSVQEGEVVGIIGRNGAGKSTLLKILSRISYPTSGSMKIRGRRVASLIEVGTGFHEELTGRENILLNGSILGMKKKEIISKMDQIVSFSGLEKFLDTPLKRYSTGMKLRLGFAVAAHLDPDVLFVDEVLAVGDADFQKKCLRTMDNLKCGGRTVLFVSHNMSAVENLCQRAIWIDAGKIMRDGEAKDVIQAYLSSFAQTQRSGYDLTDIENRIGEGAIKYTGIEFLDSDGNPTNLIRSGHYVKIRLFFHAEEDIFNPIFAIKFFSQTGTLVTTISTWGTGMDIPQLKPGDGSIDLDISYLSLMPGRFFLTLALQKVGHYRYDVLEHCVAFDVEASDVYNSGKGLNGRWGLMFFNGEWTLNSETHLQKSSRGV
jgi:lipopolysaccharide transport system ATP-binding protein